MSQTLYVSFRDNGFWAYDVASSVFLEFLIDAATQLADGDSNHWLTEAIQHWRVNAVISDSGFHLDDDWSESQIDTVIDLCCKAVAAIRDYGDIPASEAQSWPILDDRRMFVRGHDPVPCEPVARLGDAIIALLQNTLPEPPDRHWRFFTLADDIDTIAMRADA